MPFRLRTQDELFATGWTSSTDGGYHNSSVHVAYIPADMFRELSGMTFETDSVLYINTRSSQWSICPEMLISTDVDYSVAVGPAYPADITSPYRIPLSSAGSSVIDPTNNFGIQRIPPGMDFLQVHAVQLATANSDGSYLLSDGGVVGWSNIGYSNAYRAFVRTSDMTGGGDRELSVRAERDQRTTTRYYVRRSGGDITYVDIFNITGTRGTINTPARDVERYLSSNNSSASASLIVSARDLQGLRPTERPHTADEFETRRVLLTQTSNNSSEATVPSLSGLSELSPEAKLTAATTKKANAIMSALVATKSLKQAESLLQCGLEFEFHKLRGKGRGEFAGTVDEARLAKGIDDKLTTLLSTTNPLYWYAVKAGGWTSGSLQSIIRGLGESKLGFDALNGPIREAAEAQYNKVVASYRDYIRQGLLAGNSMAYFSDNGITNWDAISAYTQIGDDGSVQGGEIRTLGPRTTTEFLTVCKALADSAFTVGENTSFHVHVSVKGIKHAYGQRFQAEMYAYLLRNIHRVPDMIRKRMVSATGGTRYARMVISTEKYSAIHFHPQGSWEFRLFGNIHDYKEMRLCLQLAYEALRHAYAVKLGKSESLLGKVSVNEIQRVLEKMLASPEKFFETYNRDVKFEIEPTAA